jgi:hypothetical protein
MITLHTLNGSDFVPSPATFDSYEEAGHARERIRGKRARSTAQIVNGTGNADRDRERLEARALLLTDWPKLKPGDTLLTNVEHTARSGMTRKISLFVIRDNTPMRLSAIAARALRWGYDDKMGAVVVAGCGMDMGFQLVYSLSSVLFAGGHPCIATEKRRCPSNDHNNGHDADFHRDGGYALSHLWL